MIGMDSRISLLMGNKAATPELMQRAAVASDQFDELPTMLREKLVAAAGRHNIVLRRLALGDWDGLVRALHGLHVTYPNNGYADLAEELDVESLKRSAVARHTLQQLPATLREKLARAAERHMIVRRKLMAGTWEALTRTLLSLSVTYKNHGYAELATEFNPHVPHALDV